MSVQSCQEKTPVDIQKGLCASVLVYLKKDTSRSDVQTSFMNILNWIKSFFFSISKSEWLHLIITVREERLK